jgi:hypothetical protein
MLAKVAEFKSAWKVPFEDKDFFAELTWRRQLDKASARSGRLMVIEEVAPIAEGQAAGVKRVLCLCACGNTKIVQARDILRARAISCSANCRHRLDIRHPHFKNQRTLSRKTKKLIRLGPPKWDPELRKGVFADGYSPTKKG